MIYILFYKSSFTDQNKIFHTLLFGTLLYMIIHMVITFIDSETLNIVKNNYFKLFVMLDLISVIYIAHDNGHINIDSNKSDDKRNDKVDDINNTIDKLKNTINNITGNKDNDHVVSFSHGHNDINIDPHLDIDLDIPQIDVPQIQPIQPPHQNNNGGSFSTPISSISMSHHPSQLQMGNNNPNIPTQIPKQPLDENRFPPINDPIQQEMENLAKKINKDSGSKSTPINKLKNIETHNNTSIVNLTGNDEQPNLNNQFSGNISETMSDIESNLDLDLSEFENSL